MAKNKPTCEVKTDRACNNQCVRLLTGKRKSDPHFRCCIGCWSDLRMSGVKLHEVAEKEAKRD